MQVKPKDQKLKSVTEIKSVVVEAETGRVSRIAHQDALADRNKTPLKPTISDGLSVKREALRRLEYGSNFCLRWFCILLASEIILNA